MAHEENRTRGRIRAVSTKFSIYRETDLKIRLGLIIYVLNIQSMKLLLDNC